MLLGFSKRRIKLLETKERDENTHDDYSSELIIMQQKSDQEHLLNYYESQSSELNQNQTVSQQKPNNTQDFTQALITYSETISQPNNEKQAQDTSENKKNQLHYITGYEDKIKELSEAITQKPASLPSKTYEIVTPQTPFEEKIPTAIQKDVTALVDASLKSADVITIFQEISNKINLFALRSALEVGKATEKGESSSDLAVELKNLAEQTSKAAEKLQSYMFSIQNTITDTTHTLIEQQPSQENANEDIPIISKQDIEEANQCLEFMQEFPGFTEIKDETTSSDEIEGFDNQLKQSLADMQRVLAKIS